VLAHPVSQYDELNVSIHHRKVLEIKSWAVNIRSVYTY